MNEVITKMIEDLKANRWTVLKMEKELGFSNGTLGKVASGKVNFSAEKEKKFHEFYAKYGAVKTMPETKKEATHWDFEKQIEAYLNSPENIEYRKQLMQKYQADLFNYGKAIIKEENGRQEVIPVASVEGQNMLDLAEKQEIEGRIAEIEKELKNPPKNPLIGLSNWVKVRQMDLDKLKKQLIP